MITSTCEVCSKPFSVYPADVRKGGGKCCSVLCRNRRLATAKRRNFAERFWEKVTKTPSCWLWTGGKTQDGYGQMNRDGLNVRANRISWELHNGPIPDGQFVLHCCDNPSCVRPDHLFLGDDAINMADRNAKNRQARGERSGGAKLTASVVQEIRSEHATGTTSYRKLASKHKVGRSTIQAIIERHSWGHV